MTKPDLVALADELDSAIENHLHASVSNKEACAIHLRDVLWDNKVGISKALRHLASHPSLYEAGPCAWLRDVGVVASDGQHDECLVPASKGDPGAFPVYRAAIAATPADGGERNTVADSAGLKSRATQSEQGGRGDDLTSQGATVPTPSTAGSVREKVGIDDAIEAINRGEYRELPPLNDGKRVPTPSSVQEALQALSYCRDFVSDVAGGAAINARAVENAKEIREEAIFALETVESALSAPVDTPVAWKADCDASAAERVLSELMDRRLLNDVDDDLHQEIADALIRAARGDVSVKRIKWRGPIDAFPATIWEAKTAFGHFVIEEVSASDCPAYEVRFAGNLVAVKDDVESAKAATQADYEQRIRSALTATKRPLPSLPSQTQEYTLRAMAKNYANGNLWDDLDREAVTKAADEIKALRSLLGGSAR